MKLQEAQDIISGRADRSGYVVSFEIRGNGLLASDHFPDVHAGEPGIASRDEARKLAEAFAKRRSAKRDIVNVHLCHADDFTPVGDAILNRCP